MRQTPRPVAVQSSPPAPLLVSYIVAARALPAGTLARDDDFTTRAVAAADLPADAIVESPEARTGLRGSLIRNYLDTGNPVTRADILRPRDRGFLASVLSPGSRAVSVAVDAVSGVSGLVWPGDHVDIVLTHQIDKANPAHHVLSETVLANVRVIAIDQEIVQGATSVGKVAQTATLQVAPEQVEKVTVAGHLGKLTLSIRSATEPDAIVPATTTFAGDVSPALGRQGNDHTMTVFEGRNAKEYTFKTGEADGR
ncbi:MAG TPA: Flp pilus assembly protein CpaB, partial [Acetobacteraceae bacterium]|jgi:pilus assembly protein CpaB|nr:Flp pilus assembly protein CpaB [Acetobacteraceae bacterium]